MIFGSKKIENKHFFLLLLTGIVILTYLTVRPLLALIIMAYLIVNLFNPVYDKFFQLTKGRVHISSALTTAVVFLSVIIPFIFLSFVIIAQVQVFVDDLEEFTGVSFSGEEEISKNENSEEIAAGTEAKPADDSIGNFDVQKLIDSANEQLDKIPFLDTDISIDKFRNGVADLAAPVGTFVLGRALDIAQNTPRLITNTIVFITLIISLFPLQRRFKKYVMKVSPLSDEIDNLYWKKIIAMATSMIKGTFVIAIAQGSIAGLLLWAAGVDYVVFWTLLSIFFSVIPVGAGIVALPIAVILLLTGDIPGALIIITGNLLLVGTVDNFLRPRLVSKEAELHPALTLIGIVGGIQAFGFMGFIYGPVIMIFLITTLDIYVHYYKE